MAQQGNLNIFSDDEEQRSKKKDEPDMELGFSEKEYVDKFLGTNATAVLHFYHDELDEIAKDAIVTRDPKNGRVSTITITYREKRKLTVSKAVDKLRDKVRSLSEKEVVVPEDKKWSFAELDEEYKDSKDVLLVPDIAFGKMLIIGKTQPDVAKAAHKLQVKAEVVKTTGVSRQNRQVSDTPTYASIVSKKNSESDNVEKFQKKVVSSFKDKSLSASNNGSSWHSFDGSTSFTKTDNLYRKNFAGSERNQRVYGRQSSNPSYDVDEEFTLKNGMVLKVYNASILQIDVDVIVNAANDSMMHGGGVARVISQAAGYELDRESRQYVDRKGLVEVTKNIVTTAGNLTRCKAVIHAVGPEWYKYRDKVRCLDDLYDCVYNILDTCKEKKFKTVGMTAISAGIFAVPKELCADMYVYAAAKFSTNLDPADCPRELHIVDIDTSILGLVLESAKRWQKNPESLNQRLSVPRFLEEHPESAGASGYDHGSGGRHRGKRHHSGRNSYEEDMEVGYDSGSARNAEHLSTRDADKSESVLKLSCEIKKVDDEKFIWGAIATRFLLDEHMTIKIYKGVIEKVKGMDAIVCGTDRDLQKRGYIAEALLKAGGYDYESSYKSMERKHLTSVKYGDIFKCRAGKLGCVYVLHAVVKRIVNTDKAEINAYQECILNILKKAEKNRLVIVALPLIGTGTITTNFNNLKKVGVALLKALDCYMKDSKSRKEIKEIHLINNTPLVCKALKEVFEEAADYNSNRKTDNSSFASEHNNQERGKGNRRGRGHNGSDWDRSRSGGSESHGHNNPRSSENATGKVRENGEGRNDGATRSTTDSDTLDSDPEHHYEEIGNIDDDSPDVTDSTKKEPEIGNLLIIEDS